MPVPADEAAPSVIPNHSAHPDHKLKRVAGDGGDLFICGGCKEPGAGTRYACDHEPERCNDFALHTCCAVAPDRLEHPAFGDRVFLFLQEPEPPREGGTGVRSCAACGEDVCGFVYHCFLDDIDLHPCCALLPEHAIVSALGKKVAAASRPRGTSGDGKEQSENAHRVLPAARHRGGDGRQAGKQDPPPTENTQPMNNRVSLEFRRQEVSRPGDRNRDHGRERAPAVARHRWWTWNWKR